MPHCSHFLSLVGDVSSAWYQFIPFPHHPYLTKFFLSFTSQPRCHFLLTFLDLPSSPVWKYRLYEYRLYENIQPIFSKYITGTLVTLFCKWFVTCLSPPPPHEQIPYLSCSLFYLQHLEQFLVHRSCSMYNLAKKWMK